MVCLLWFLDELICDGNVHNMNIIFQMDDFVKRKYDEKIEDFKIFVDCIFII